MYWPVKIIEQISQWVTPLHSQINSNDVNCWVSLSTMLFLSDNLIQLFILNWLSYCLCPGRVNLNAWTQDGHKTHSWRIHTSQCGLRVCQYGCFIRTGERAHGLTHIPAQVRDLTNAITGLLHCQGENGLNPGLLIITMHSCLRTVNEFLINYSFLI